MKRGGEPAPGVTLMITRTAYAAMLRSLEQEESRAGAILSRLDVLLRELRAAGEPVGAYTLLYGHVEGLQQAFGQLLPPFRQALHRMGELERLLRTPPKPSRPTKTTKRAKSGLRTKVPERAKWRQGTTSPKRATKRKRTRRPKRAIQSKRHQSR